jgi:uncharacterized OB-fold protein
MELELWACEQCGHVVFPRRLLCPRCGSAASRAVPAGEGVVRETTVRRRRVSEDRREAHGDWRRVERVRLVSVETERGPVVVARAFEELAPGARVRLELESGAPVARGTDAIVV